MGIDTGTSSWQLLDKSAFSSDLNFGTVSLSVDDFVLLSELGLGEMTNLTVGTGTIEALARLDDPVRYLKNYINVNDAMAVTFSYNFSGEFGDLKDRYSDPLNCVYSGYAIGINPMNSAFSEADVLTLEPPGTIVLDGTTYNPGDQIPGRFYDFSDLDLGWGTKWEFGFGSSTETLFQEQIPGDWILRSAGGM